MKNNFQKIAIGLIVAGILFLLTTAYLFIARSEYPVSFKGDKVINSSVLNDFGSLTAGTVGLLWSLAGVFLLIASLQEQKKATQDNSKSMRVQQFENTFFQLINVHYQIVNSLKMIILDEAGVPLKNEDGFIAEKNGISCFLALAQAINEQFTEHNHGQRPFVDIAKEQLYIYSAELGHYFGNFFNIIRYVYSTKNIDDNERANYFEILKGQLSNYELVIILYQDFAKANSLQKEIIEKFQIFENLDLEILFSGDYQRVLVDPLLFVDDYPHLKALYQTQITTAR